MNETHKNEHCEYIGCATPQNKKASVIPFGKTLAQLTASAFILSCFSYLLFLKASYKARFKYSITRLYSQKRLLRTNLPCCRTFRLS